MLRKSILSAFMLCAVALSAHAQSGIASVYQPSDPDGGGPLAANGEQINPDDLTAAHKTLPLGMLVRVTNKRNGRSVVVRINDRGPFIKGRIIDLTPAGARAIGMDGLAQVDLTLISNAVFRSVTGSLISLREQTSRLNLAANSLPSTAR
jgi:rare lipoprotein A